MLEEAVGENTVSQEKEPKSKTGVHAEDLSKPGDFRRHREAV